MKIISGVYKGRRLEGFDIEGTRPTMDRVKESLFAIIQNSIKDAIVLDLFAGSGNLGLEALSNGAKYAYLVDKNKKAISTIKTNLDLLRVSNSIIFNCDYQLALKNFFEKKIKFDLIFLDPPYKTDYIEKSILLIDEYSLLNKNGMIICESDSLDKIVYNESYICVKNRKYGDKYIVILKQM